MACNQLKGSQQTLSWCSLCCGSSPAGFRGPVVGRSLGGEVGVGGCGLVAVREAGVGTGATVLLAGNAGSPLAAGRIAFNVSGPDDDEVG